MSDAANKSSPSLFSSITSLISDASSLFIDADGDTVIDNEKASPLLFSSEPNLTPTVILPPTPILPSPLSSTPILSQELPTTQDLQHRLLDLRDDGTCRAGAKAATPKLLLNRGPLSFANDDHHHHPHVAENSPPHYRIIEDKHVDDTYFLRRQVEELKSELTALRLQFDIDREEKRALVKENENLRQQLTSSAPNLPSPTSHRDSDGVTSISNGGLGGVTSTPAPEPEIDGVPTIPVSEPESGAVTSSSSTGKSKANKKKKKTRNTPPAAAAVTPDAATASVAAAASNATARPNAQTDNGQSSYNIHIMHDSNTKTKPDELKTYFDNIIRNNNNNNNNNAKFILHPTYTLEGTRNKIKTLLQNSNLKKEDHIIITTLTNNARTTNSGRHSSTYDTTHIQTDIVNILTRIIPRKHITFLEAPPLLASHSSDIYPYNLATYNTALRLGANFAPTLVGAEHIWLGTKKRRDGFHVQYRFCHLLNRSIAAAAAYINPQQHFKLPRPPFGPFGPWASPRGMGILPTPVPPLRDPGQFPPLSFRDMALARPIHFRNKNH